MQYAGRRSKHVLLRWPQHTHSIAVVATRLQKLEMHCTQPGRAGIVETRVQVLFMDRPANANHPRLVAKMRDAAKLDREERQRLRARGLRTHPRTRSPIATGRESRHLYIAGHGG